jgi:GT2 family glycosyltransferase
MADAFSIVTVNYNNAALLIEVLDRTLGALADHDFETIAVDNGSTDGSMELLQGHYIGNPKVRIISSGRNGGFGFGCNAGARVAKTGILWFLNSDAWLASADGMDEVLALVHKPQSGLVGTSVLLDTAESTPQGGSEMTFAYYMISSFRLGAFFRKLSPSVKQALLPALKFLPGPFGKYVEGYKSGYSDSVFERIGVGGASFLIRRALYDQIGGFDEEFFLYDEDGDLCLRCIQSGHVNYVVPRAKVLTYPSATTSKMRSTVLKIIKRKSRIRLISKHFHGWRRGMLHVTTLLTWRLL